MRPLVCFIAASLDGYIAGPSGEIDWLFTDQDYGYIPFYANVDTVVMGRKTYDLCLTFAEYPYPGILNYVMSGHAPVAARTNTPPSCPAMLRKLLKGLKQKEGNKIWLVGGSALVGEAITHDLLDELIVSVHPMVLGDGVPLFPHNLREHSSTSSNPNHSPPASCN